MPKTYSVLVIGSGGREHAIAWKLAQSPLIDRLFIAPGNAGTEVTGENVALDLSSNKAVVEFAKKNAVDLVVVTPDDYLAAGMVDDLAAAGIKAFGPSKKAAQIESSKAFSKELMKTAGIPTARHESFTDYDIAKEFILTHPLPVVLKASGLALGKGVIIARTRDEALTALGDIMQKRIFGEAGNVVVIEEFLTGAEISIHAYCDGKTAVLFPTAQDHKQISDGDHGPNTGGMGTIAPVPWVTRELMHTIKSTIVDPALKALSDRGMPFKGCLYPGLMITKEGPKVLEFNARFGDPETQSYMRLLESDLLPILMACCDGALARTEIRWKPGFAACVVVASRGYPERSEKDVMIEGIEAAGSRPGIVVFHAGTKCTDRVVVTNGGRVLGVTAAAPVLDQALKNAYEAVHKIQFSGMQYRKDIGRRKPPAP